MRLLVGVLTTDCHDSESGVLPLNTKILEANINLIKLKDSEICHVTGHAPSGHQWSLLLAVACVAGNRQLSIEMNGIVSLCHWESLVVWTGALFWDVRMQLRIDKKHLYVRSQIEAKNTRCCVEIPCDVYGYYFTATTSHILIIF